MKDAHKPDHISLNTLINRLREGRFVIPDFQREFEWSSGDIRDLMRSIFLDYYIGSLLLWKGKSENFSALSCEAIYGYSGSSKPESIVLDGQQRLTAMYYAFLAPNKPLPNRAWRHIYYIRVDKFMALEYDDAFYSEWLTKRWAKIFENQQAQFEEHIFPLSVVGAGGWDLPNWVQGYEKFWRNRESTALSIGDNQAAKAASEHAENARAFGEHIRGIIEQYQISYVELDQDLEVHKVCDIFTQINSRGVRLDVFDLMNALLKPKSLQLKHMWREAAPRLEFVQSEKMNVYILQVMSILRQGYCSPKYLYFLLPGEERPVRDPDGIRRREVLVPDIKDFEKRWKSAVNALEDAIKLLRHPQEFGAISSDYLPYVTILPVFASLQAHVKTLPATQWLDAQRKIRHWYWASVFTVRYSGAVESTSTRDFLDVKAWIENDEAEPALLLEFKTRFKNMELRKETKRGTSVYNGIFNLLVLQEARDWMTGQVPQYGNLDDHHIVPVSWNSKNGGASPINSILNRTPLTAETNRHIIADRLPNAYLPELIAKNGEKKVREILASHFISPTAQEILMRNPFMPDDFEAFITERQHTLQDAIETLLIKERLDLPLSLRELDERIEQVELGLRAMITDTLDGDTSLLPSHIAQKVKDRIQIAIRNNPSLDGENHKSLASKLEFSDLRELEEIMYNKTLWPRFSRRFISQSSTTTKFGQLAELRNGIRHSRTVTEITHKEGEASILWFEQVLAK